MEEDRKTGRKDKHTTNNTTTTSAVDVIVKDLMDHILRKLPLKDLVRFKCVCKAWCNSIPRIAKYTHGPRKIIVTPGESDPCKSIKIVDIEAAAAAAFSPNTDSDSDSETEETVRRIKLPQNAPGKVVGSCNGLLFIEFERKRKKFVLWNPLIKEFKILPVLQPSKKMLDFSSMIGFGHDGCSDDYKIVRIFAYQDSSLEALVYSLKTNSWRYLELEPPFSNNTIYELLKYTPIMATLVNGALYWSVTDLDVSHPSYRGYCSWYLNYFAIRDEPKHFRFQILQFHLADEKLRWMRAPLYVYPDSILRLMVFEGNKLCAYQNVCNFLIETWVLKGDEDDEETEEDEEIEVDELWTEFMSIPLGDGRIVPERGIAPLSFVRDGKVLLCKCIDFGITSCRLYNGVRTEKLKKDLGVEGWRYEHITYEESIESLDRYNGIQRGIKPN
ncbi:hypothetical protein FNV43_RR00847 [Rhamnella rubrinervis]|uniref:F-box domain-containing protein n=1 Tax=Rhamnella rubrinervis TaxID=2594499 RepID=A0A8K0HNK0_9ROSA|nr:hypothetical protein FNV43_RR00847 [Rhamnella rubrinervis]